jgi:hypothetical protein
LLRRLAFGASGCALFGAAVLPAQEPARLPAVVVNATPPLPGRNLLVGVVVDTFAVPIGGVEVSIPGLRRRATSDTAGRFRFEKIDAGTYEVRARKIGYAPQVRTFTVAKDGGGTGAFMLLQFARSLPVVMTSAARGGVSGTVGDTGYRPIMGAAVRAMGHDLVTWTDSNGSFFLPARPGKYMIAIHGDGFDDRLFSVVVPRDSGRHVTAMLFPASARAVQWQSNLAALSSRLMRRLDSFSAFYTRDDMIAESIEWVHDVVAMEARLPRGVDKDCSAVKNGGPETVNLDKLTVDDVESVEIYRPATPTQAPPSRPGTSVAGRRRVARSKPGVPLDNIGTALSENWGRSCPVVYVWLR